MVTRRLASMLALLAISAPALAQKGQSSAFRPIKEAAESGPRTGKEGSWSLSLAFSSIVPFGSPYTLQEGATATTKFRFQLPVTAGLGLLYGWTDRFDIGVEVGLESFGTRVNFTGDDDLQIAEYTAYPIRALARYRFGQSTSFVPELEIGAGYAFGTATVSSTIIGSKTFEKKLGYLTGHAAAGVAVAWNDETTLHAQFGASYSALGKEEFVDANATTVQSSMLGGFVRAGMTYRF